MPKKGKDTGMMKAADFLKKIPVCGESAFDSVGYGRDYRYGGGRSGGLRSGSRGHGDPSGFLSDQQSG